MHRLAVTFLWFRGGYTVGNLSIKSTSMSNNPYSAPQAPSNTAVGVKSGKRDDLKSVALYQRGINIGILIYLLTILGTFTLPTVIGQFLPLLLIPLAIAMVIFIVLLSMKTFGIALGIIFAVLALIPFLGLFILLLVNNRATRILTANGIKVGLLGAKFGSI